MRIVVCFKNVPDEQEFTVRANRSLDMDKASWSIGQYDLNAVQAAMDLSAVSGAEVIALTAAGSIVDNSKQKKAILSRGPQKMVGVKSEDFAEASSYVTATALAEAIQRIGEVDLVLFGEGSGDMYAQITGLMTGSILGWPCLNAVSSIEVEDNALLVQRSLEKEDEKYRLTLPVVLSVTADINRPKIPSMKDILGAGKKPTEIWEDFIPAKVPVETVSIQVPEQTERKKVIFQSVTEEAMETIAAVIQN